MTIFYYTGTGNSLWVSRRLADNLGGARLVSIPGIEDAAKAAGSETVGLVFPVYIWGVPAPVIRFVSVSSALDTGYVYAIAVNAGQVSNTLVQLKDVLARRGVDLSAGFQIRMPSNYIPWGGPGPVEKQRKLFGLADEKIADIASCIRERRSLPVEKGPLWQRIVFTFIYKMTFSRVPAMDEKFWVDERCNGCGVCSRVCPAANIILAPDRPAWNHACDQCFACLQWCPQEAIQCGRKTPAFERYHQPEIQLKDIIQSRTKTRSC
ncbi:MAG TPA: EFR1 family ferrodoxin [Deltaproteobacteria bacterium]|nr:EFR1 family ferrodoxin [Deltaproteobacteria bacterium]